MPPELPSSGALREDQEWLARAERDLQAARNELRAAVPLPEMSAYHAQQAMERSLKAFLTANSIPFPYTHDLVLLQAKCEAIQGGFARFLPLAQTLSPYATLFRYPGGPLSPPSAEAQQAVDSADAIVRFIRQQL